MFHPFLKTISKYLDNWVTESKARKLIRHVEKCETCKHKLDILKNVESIVACKKTADEKVADAITSHLPEIKRTRLPIVGVIQGIRGSMMVSQGENEEEEEGFVGMGLKQGDSIKLLDNSVALVEMSDGSCLWLNRSTEIDFKSGAKKMALLAGEIFAMMKPQKESFIITTPSAVLSVIGTDFDTKVKEDAKTVLSVLKGKVSFRNNKGETIVTKRRQVEADKNSKPSQVRIENPLSISQWTTSMQISKKKGKMTFKSLYLTALLIIILLFGILWVKGRDERNGNVPGSGSTSFNKNAPLLLSSPYLQKGMSWRTRINKKIRKNNIPDFHDFLDIDLVTEILDVDPQKGGHAIVTVEDVRVNKPKDGQLTGIAEIDRPEQENLGGAANMAGRKLEYYVSPDGTIHSLANYDGKAFTPDELRVWSYVILDNHFSILFPGNSMSPGNKWNNKFELNMPGYPNGYIKRQDQVSFAGYENQNDQQVAVFRSRYDITIGGGIKLFSLVRGNAEQSSLLDEFRMNGAANYYVDVQSGRVVCSMGKDFENYIKGRTEFRAPNRPVQSQTREEKLSNEYTNSITIEYISNE